MTAYEDALERERRARAGQAFYEPAYFGAPTQFNSTTTPLAEQSGRLMDQFQTPGDYARARGKPEVANWSQALTPAYVGGFSSGATPPARIATGISAPPQTEAQQWADMYGGTLSDEGTSVPNPAAAAYRGEQVMGGPPIGMANLDNYGRGQLENYGIGHLQNYGLGALGDTGAGALGSHRRRRGL